MNAPNIQYLDPIEFQDAFPAMTRKIEHDYFDGFSDDLLHSDEEFDLAKFRSGWDEYLAKAIKTWCLDNQRQVQMHLAGEQE